MQDRPTAKELVEAVAQFLSGEVAPAMEDARLKFRMLVAANVLTVVAREMELGEAQARGEYERLVALLGHASLTPQPPRSQGEGEYRLEVERMTRELAARIRAGKADEGAFHDAVMAHVEETVMEKLRVANPRYLERLKG